MWTPKGRATRGNEDQAHWRVRAQKEGSKYRRKNRGWKTLRRMVREAQD